MAPPSRKILVLGATGVIGKVLLDALLTAKADFDAIGLFTSPATAASKPDLLAAFQARGAVLHIGDLYSEEDVLNVYGDYDTVVSALGRASIDKQIDLIALADRCPSIVRFLPSEYGTDVEYDASSATEPTHQKKLKVRAFLQTLHSLHYALLVTGPFADLLAAPLAAAPRLGTFDVATRTAVLLVDDDHHSPPIGMTTVADVGRALVAVLQHPEATDNRAVRVQSFVASPADLLAEFERQTGGSPWTVTHTTSLAELRQIEADAWAADAPLASICTLRRIWAEGKTLYATTDNAAIGLRKTDTLEMVVQRAILQPQAAFQSGRM